MAERDVFESRLRAALLRHVADGPTEFDALGFARTVAAKEPRRQALRGLAGTQPWRGGAVPRVAWVLFLLALLSALVGGTLLVGSRLQQELPAVIPPIGEVFACPAGSTPDEPGPIDQVRPPDDPSAVAFDRRAGRLVAVTNAGDGIQTWTFDVCTNSWARMDPVREPPSFEAVHLVYDVDSDTTIAAEMGKPTWAYDLQADTWTRKGVPPDIANERWFGWTYDPESGLVIVAADDEVWSYDVDIDRWTRISRAPWSSGATLAYDGTVDRIVAYTRTATWLLDIRSGTWSKSIADSPAVYSLWGMNDYAPVILYDTAAGRTVVADLQGRTAAYDATEDRWEILSAETGPGVRPQLPFSVYDPVNERLVGLNADSVLAFDLTTRERIVLLEPTEGRSAP